MDKELYQVTIHENRRLLDKKEIYSKDLLSSVFERIENRRQPDKRLYHNCKRYRFEAGRSS